MSFLVALILFGFLVFTCASTESSRDTDDIYGELLAELEKRRFQREKESLRKLADEALDEVEAKDFKCADINKSCSFFKHCCGSYYCTDIKGTCVECIKQGQKCWRNAQCCPGTKCVRDFFFNIHGKCKATKK